MNLDYLEIGTSDFDTLVQQLDSLGMSVEPIKYYLNRLPDKENNTKVNCAISPDDTEGEIEIYYIPEKTIQKHNLPAYVKGQNRIGDYHPGHKKDHLEQHVIKESVKLMSIKTLIESYNIQSIRYLKTDTEGLDCKILTCLYNYIHDKTELHPKEILFESNSLTKPEDVQSVIELYKNIGYSLAYSTGNTCLRK